MLTTYDHGITKPPNVFEFLSIHSQLGALTNAIDNRNINVKKTCSKNFFNFTRMTSNLKIKILGNTPSKMIYTSKPNDKKLLDSS